MGRRPPMHRVNIYTQAHTSSMHLHFIYVQIYIYIYIYTYVRSLRSANDGHIHRCHREEHSRGHYGNGNDPERDGRLKGKRTKRHKRRQGNCDRLIGATVKDDDKYMYTCVSIYIYIYMYTQPTTLKASENADTVEKQMGMSSGGGMN